MRHSLCTVVKVDVAFLLFRFLYLVLTFNHTAVVCYICVPGVLLGYHKTPGASPLRKPVNVATQTAFVIGSANSRMI